MFSFVSYHNDLKYRDRQFWANSVDPDQTTQGLHCHSVSIFWPTVKILKIRAPQRIAVIILKLEQNRLTTDELAQKMKTE